jgi:hypothetical protein
VAHKTRSEKWCFSTRHKWAHCTRSRATVLATTTHQTSLSSNVLQWRFKCLAKSDVFHLYKKRFFQIIAKTTPITTEENRLENSVGQFWQSFGNLNESRLGTNGQTERTHAVLATRDLLTLNRSGWQWCCLWIAHCCWSNESMGCTTKLLIEWRWVCMPCHTTANKDV